MNKEPNTPLQKKKPGLQSSAKSNNLWILEVISNFGDTKDKGLFIGLSILFNHHTRIPNLTKINGE
jgi:hypothetical protein